MLSSAVDCNRQLDFLSFSPCLPSRREGERGGMQTFDQLAAVYLAGGDLERDDVAL